MIRWAKARGLRDVASGGSARTLVRSFSPIKRQLRPDPRDRILNSGEAIGVKPTTFVLLGVLLLVLVPGPVVALSNPSANSGCCCHKGRCPVSAARNMQRCCGSEGAAPIPLNEMAPMSTTQSSPDVPVGSVESFDVTRDTRVISDFPSATTSGARSHLHALHEVFLI